jgi:hypothetical protein
MWQILKLIIFGVENPKYINFNMIKKNMSYMGDHTAWVSHSNKLATI